MTPNCQAIRDRLDLTQSELAKLTGASRSTIARAEADPPVMEPRLAQMLKLLDRFGKDAIKVLQEG